MEKVMLLLSESEADDRWCAHLRGPVAAEILSLGVAGLTINVRDATVRESQMTFTTMDPPVVAVVGLWTQQSYGEQVNDTVVLLGKECQRVAAYLVTESVPMAPPATKLGERTTGLANIALLRRPTELEPATWLKRWLVNHTPVAIETQATFGYTQNVVARALTADAPAIDAIVEELFPLEAISSMHAFFGAADDNDLRERMNRMVASTSAFGANENIDTVPTSRYVLRTPFD